MKNINMIAAYEVDNRDLSIQIFNSLV